MAINTIGLELVDSRTTSVTLPQNAWTSTGLTVDANSDVDWLFIVASAPGSILYPIHWGSLTALSSVSKTYEASDSQWDTGAIFYARGPGNVLLASRGTASQLIRTELYLYKIPGAVTYSETTPSDPDDGQLWYKPSTNTLSIREGSNWIAVSGASVSSGPTTVVSATAPANPESGQGWYDTTEVTLKVWNGTAWAAAVPESIGKARISTIATTNPEPGSLWFDLTNNVLNVWDSVNSLWKPAVTIPVVTIGQSPPANPAFGQFWYDTTDGVLQLKIWNSAVWLPSSPDSTGGSTTITNNNIIGATVGITAPANPVSGALWYDSSSDDLRLKVWNGTLWVNATPVTASDPDTTPDTPDTPDTPSVTPSTELSIDALATAMRLEVPLETEQAQIITRLSSVAGAIVNLYAETAPVAIKQEGIIRLAAYLFDMPEVSPGLRYSMAWRSSGAAALLGPWIVRRARIVNPDGATTSTGGSADNPVVSIEVVNDELITTFADGSTDTDGLPATTTDFDHAAAQALIDAHAQNSEAHHTPVDISDRLVRGDILAGSNVTLHPVGEKGVQISATVEVSGDATDATARAAAAAAQQTADAATTPAEATALMKVFAQAGSTELPNPGDLGNTDDVQTGAVLSLGSHGGTFVPNWRPLSNPGFFVSGADEPTSNLAPAGGHYLRIPTNGPAEMWVRYGSDFPWVKIATFPDSIVRDTGSGLPLASDNQGRLGVSGNQIFESINHGHDKVVTFAPFTDTLFAGEFDSPPDVDNYVAGAYLWDRGSQVWLRKLTLQSISHWQEYGGPTNYRHGSLFYDEEQAARHIGSASEIGRIVIIGQGAAQNVRVVTAFTAAAADNWVWDPIGVTLRDVHDTANALVNAHNGNDTAHADIRQLIAAISNTSGVVIAPYSSTANYSKGGATSFVTHSSGFYIYISGTARAANHDPGEHPEYWFRVDHGAEIRLISTGSHRFAEGTLIVIDDDVFLAATDIQTPRDAAYIRTNTGSGQEFIKLTNRVSGWALSDALATDTIPLARQEVFRQFNPNRAGQLWREGELCRFGTDWYLINTTHQQGVGEAPDTSDDYVQVNN